MSRNFNKVYNHDARLILDSLGVNVKIKATITSPPYFDMKDYGSDNQVGFGQNYDCYLNDLQKIFGNILNITEDDGTLWIIIDTFKRNNQVTLLPFDLANKLKEIGWLLQEIIIWKKDKTVPWSTNGFMQRKFEYILLFSKSSKYKSNKDSVRVYDTSQLKRWWVKYPERYNPKGKALDEVWEFPIPVQGSWGDEYIRHFCPLPKEMVATMIQISTDEGDTILDPFSGSGTVLFQAACMNRNYIGFELNLDYIKMFESYKEKSLTKYSNEYQLLKNNNTQSQFERQILELRALKYGRVLLNNLEKILNLNDLKIVVEMGEKKFNKNINLIVKYELVGVQRSELLLEHIDVLIRKPPLSKFGISPIITFIDHFVIGNNEYFGYSKTNSYSYVKNENLYSSQIKILSKIKVDLNENDYS